MRIALDADHLYRFPLRGIQKTTLSLYQHLWIERPDWQITAFHQVPGTCVELESLPTVVRRRIDYKGERLIGRFHPWNAFRLPVATFGFDVVHAPASHGPWWSPSPIVLTIHDLTPLEFPEPGTRDWWTRVRRSARGAQRIVTCSRHVASRIIRELPDTAGRVEVIYWGRTEAYRPASDSEIASVIDRCGLPTKPYVLTFGTRHPRKNLARLLAAWLSLPTQARDAFDLLIVGSTAADVQALGLTGSGLPAGVRVVNGLDERDIPAVISGASVLCYLSLSEGFGLPVLEAFACGTTVLASATTSIPEVAGEAAVLVDPESQPAIARGLTRLLESSALRDDLRAAGLARALEFDWSRCAREYASVFESCTR